MTKELKHALKRIKEASQDTRISYRAGAQNDKIGIMKIGVQSSRNKRMTEHHDIFSDRKPEYHQDLVKIDF